MSDNFALNWALLWLALFGLFAFVGLTFRVPLPSMRWCLTLGALHGAILVGPIVWVSFNR